MSRQRNDSLVFEMASFATLLPSWMALIAGVIPFLLCYFAIPYWMHHHINSTSNSMLAPLIEQIMNFRIRGIKCVGIACLIGGSICALRNRNSVTPVCKGETSVISTIAELITWLFGK